MMKLKNALFIALLLSLIAMGGLFESMTTTEDKIDRATARVVEVQEERGIVIHTKYLKIHEVVRVYDGDTVYVNIKNLPPVFGENIGVRIPGIDTPEMRVSTKLPEETRQCLKRMAERTKHDLENFVMSGEKWELDDSSVEARGKYFRILSDIIVDGQSAREYMLKYSLFVKPYNGGTKEEWKCQS